MSHSKSGKKGRSSRGIGLILLAWFFIGGQVLLAAGSIRDYENGVGRGDGSPMPWTLVSQGAHKVRLVATQARPDVVGDIAIFLGVVNALGLVALVFGLISWSKSQHHDGKLTMAAAIVIILVNSILNLPYA
jgi:hypothetical protein